MASFGDVRSAVQARDEAALKAALNEYDDKMPSCEVVAYIRSAWGWCPATRWAGCGTSNSPNALNAYSQDGTRTDEPLIAYALDVEILRLDDPDSHVQAALRPIRKEYLDHAWMPYAQRFDNSVIRIVTVELYDLLLERDGRESVWNNVVRAMGLVSDASQYAISTHRARRAAELVTEFTWPIGVTIDPRIDRHLLGGEP